MPPPAPQPRFFPGRSLGRIAVPAFLRAAGWDLITLSERRKPVLNGLINEYQQAA